MRMPPAIVAILAAGTVVATAAQEPPVFPAAVEQVLVDALVVDGRGRPVTSLLREDFVLAEDGLPQAIASFEPPVVADPGARKGGAREPAAAGAVLAVVFDDLGLTHAQGARARAAVLAFSRSRDAAGLVLLATTSGRERWPRQDGEEPASLAEVVGRLSGLARPAASAPMTDTEACLVHVAHDGPTLERLKARYRAAVGVGEALRSGSGPLVQAEAAGTCLRAMTHAHLALAELGRATDALSSRQGRRSAVLVSGGLLRVDALPELRRLLEASRRASVTLHFVDASALEGARSFVGGPESTFGPADEARAAASSAAEPFAAAEGGRDADRAATAGAVHVAEETGGLVVSRTNALAAGIARVAADSRARYVLGYVPTRPAADDRYRTITVRLAPGHDSRRRAWTVRARRGYFPAAAARPPSHAGTEPRTAPVTGVAEAASPPDAELLPLRLRAETLEDAPGEPPRVRCLLTARVDLGRVPVHEADGRRTARLQAEFAVVAEGVADPIRIEKTVDLDLVAGAHVRRDRWLPIQAEVLLARGLHALTVTVRDAASSRAGAARVALDVPPAGALRISAPRLAEALETDESGRPRAASDEVRVFASGTTAFVSFDVFGGGPDAASSMAVSGAVETADGRKRTVRPDSLVPDGRGGLRALIRLDLEDAKPGEYRFVGRVTDARRAQGFLFEEPFAVVEAERRAGTRPVDPELATLLLRAGRYAAEYESAFRNIVAEEEYVQHWPNAPSGEPDRRRTRADLVFVRLAGPIPWASFRDVYEVDGAPVRDRTGRLQRLFAGRSASAYELAEAILAESTRYNIGLERTVNLPTLPLAFLLPQNQGRFVFERRGKAPAGEPVEVEFREVARPTFVRSRKPESEEERDSRRLDLPADGRFWIDPGRGTVVRSEVRLRTGRREATATITTRYRRESSLAMWVPDEMKESYEIHTLAAPVQMTSHSGVSRLEAAARYTRLRRFEVTTEEKVRLPDPEP
jgi:VWFA-related protein